MKKGKLLVLISFITISCSFVSCASNALETQPQTNITNEIEEDKIIKNEDKIKEEIATVEKSIKSKIGDYADNLGIYYYNPITKAEYKHNSETKFMGASMRKLPIVMSIADDIHSGTNITLDSKLTYNEETDKAGGSGVLQGEKFIGDVSIKDAIKYSMVYSDNIAHKMLKRTASRDIGPYVSDISGILMEDPYLSPEQMASLYKRLYDNPEQNPIYDYILELLKQTVYHDRIDKYLPHDKVAHKIGDYYRFFHDSALVYSDNPYILVIMSKDLGQLRTDMGDTDETLLKDEGDFACEFIAQMAKTLDDDLATYHNEK
ncbi:MAG: serine hydrolase [Sarcina sp.]